jgi:hypothetical protein
VLDTASPPGQKCTRKDGAGWRGRKTHAEQASVLSSLTIRWLVTHESTESIGMSTIVGWSRLLRSRRRGLRPPIMALVARFGIHTHTRVRMTRAQVRLEFHARVSGTLHRTVSQSQCSTGVNRRKLRESERNEQNPYGSRKLVWGRSPRRETLGPVKNTQTQVSPPIWFGPGVFTGAEVRSAWSSS